MPGSLDNTTTFPDSGRTLDNEFVPLADPLPPLPALPPAPPAIPYGVLPDTFRERYSNSGEGSTASVHLAVNGATVAAFIAYGLGFTAPTVTTPGKLSRFLPLGSPYDDSLWLTDLVLVTPGAQTATPTPSMTWPEWAWFVYRGEFSDRPYHVRSDSQVTNEWDRYVTIATLPQARELKVPGWFVEATGYGPVPQITTGFKIESTEDVELTQHDFPCVLYDYDFAAGFIGKVNDAEFRFDGLTGRRVFAPETMLYRGVAERMSPHRMRNGDLAYSPRQSFHYRPLGWNKFQARDGILYPLVIKGTSRPLYAADDMTRLFKPLS